MCIVVVPGTMVATAVLLLESVIAGDETVLLTVAAKSAPKALIPGAVNDIVGVVTVNDWVASAGTKVDTPP